MPTNIFANRDQGIVGQVESGSVSRMSGMVQCLPARQRVHRTFDLIGAQCYLAAEARERPRRLSEALDTAEPAAGRANQPALPFLESPAATSCQPHAQFDSLAFWHDLQRLDLAAVANDAFRELKPIAKSAKSAGVA